MHVLLPELEPHMADGLRSSYVPKYLRVSIQYVHLFAYHSSKINL